MFADDTSLPQLESLLLKLNINWGWKSKKPIYIYYKFKLMGKALQKTSN